MSKMRSDCLGVDRASKLPATRKGRKGQVVECAVVVLLATSWQCHRLENLEQSDFGHRSEHYPGSG